MDVDRPRYMKIDARRPEDAEYRVGGYRDIDIRERPKQVSEVILLLQNFVLVDSVFETALHFELKAPVDVFCERKKLRYLHIHSVHGLSDGYITARRIDRNTPDEKGWRLAEHGIRPLFKYVDNRRIAPMIEELGNAGCGVPGNAAYRVCTRQRIADLLGKESRRIGQLGAVARERFSSG